MTSIRNLQADGERISDDEVILMDEITVVGDRPGDGEPLRILKAELADIGVKLLDLRRHDRTAHYKPKGRCIVDGVDFGAWGYFSKPKNKDGSLKFPQDKGKNVPRRSKVRGVIPWESLTSILFHLTAVRMSAPRFLGVPVQDGVAHDGTVVLCHELNDKLWHAHAGNSFSSGIEVSSKKGEISPTQVLALQALVRYKHAERQRHHAGPMVVNAHRQTSSTRPNDPGRDIWQAGAVYAMRELGLTEGPVVGTGKPIRNSWR